MPAKPVVVLDASVALGWALPDENRGASANAALASISSASPATVPWHWRTEVGNGLLMALRRGRLNQMNLVAALATLSVLPVEVDDTGAREAWTDPLAQALASGLTLYDALYLELAKRLGVPLATFDAALRHATRAAGVPVIP